MRAVKRTCFNTAESERSGRRGERKESETRVGGGRASPI